MNAAGRQGRKSESLPKFIDSDVSTPTLECELNQNYLDETSGYPPAEGFETFMSLTTVRAW